MHQRALPRSTSEIIADAASAEEALVAIELLEMDRKMSRTSSQIEIQLSKRTMSRR